MQSLQLLLQNVLLSGNLQAFVVNIRRKKKSATAQLVLQPAYSKKLPIGDKKKADILDLLRKNSHSQILCYFL
jgi:hypothetical protein